jgi:hypothetical protein
MQGHDTNRTKFDDRDYSVECLECRETFEAKRSDATFCSARCRVRYSKRPEKLNNAIETLRMAGINARDISNKYPTNQRVETALLALRAQIDAALANMEVEALES